MADSFPSSQKDGADLDEDTKLFNSLFEPQDSDDSLGIFVPTDEYDRLRTNLGFRIATCKENLDSNAPMKAQIGTSAPSFPDWRMISDDDEHANDGHARSFSATPTGMGAGLRNLGNSCFISSILQCLTHTVPLVMALRTHNHSLPRDSGSDGFCCVLADHIERALASSGEAIGPGYFYDNLSCISTSFQRDKQEDAHEFLQSLLAKLGGGCLHQNPAEISSSSQADNIVQQLFGGRFLNKLTCCSCGRVSDKYEPLIDLSLEIEEVDTLEGALGSFTQVERMETKLTCDNCKDIVIMKKQLRLDWTPPVTIFHLKRFQSKGGSIEKIEKYVQFPLELDLRPYSTYGQDDHQVNVRYQLYGVVVHNGKSPTFGHYRCYIRSSLGKWHELNDVSVTECGEEFALSQDAYILLYAKEGTPWFSSLMEQRKVDQDLGSSCMAQPKHDAGLTIAAEEAQDGTFDEEELRLRLPQELFMEVLSEAKNRTP
ncbi:Ubiquitin carboxyl-terminal hydrolase 21 [Linum grandiflorum]